MKAILIEDNLQGFAGLAALYKLVPPLDGNEFVIVSAVEVAYSGPETYIFAANEKGKVTDWAELSGSYRGSLDHKKALANIGYQIV